MSDTTKAAQKLYKWPFKDSAEEELARLKVSHQALIDALHMAKHIVAQEGTDEQAEQVFRALELAGEKP